MKSKFDFRGVIRGRYVDRSVVTDHKKGPKSDSQLVEIAGRHLLTAQLIAGRVEVATPVRDRGIDLIAYLDRKSEDTEADFLACPIQMKAFTKQGFGLERRYERISNLLIAYVWSVQDAGNSSIYAMTYDQALDILDQQGYASTESWTRDNRYHIGKPSAKLIELLKKYKMSPDDWTELIKSTAKRR